MSDHVFVALTFACAIGCGLNGGVFFAFSSFVMPALARLPPAQGIAAMNSINASAVTPVFMTALFGTAAGCLLLCVWTLLSWQRPGASWLTVGAALYLVGSILVTIVFNVPRNDALAAVNPSTAAGGQLWMNFVVTWTAWNHVRTATALAAAALLTIGFCLARTRGVA